MLTISKMSGAGQGDYYLSLAAEDYYLSRGEPRGQSFGIGALSLRLLGSVQREALQNLLPGKTPYGSRLLVQNAGDARRLVDAANRASISPAWLARRIVLQTLDGAPTSESGIAKVEPRLTEIRKVRAEFAVVFESFLIAAEVFYSAEAHYFVTEKFA